MKQRNSITLWVLYLLIKKQKNDYEEGQNLSVDSIMIMAKNKYKSLVRTWEWNSPSKEQREILALNTKLEKLTSNNKTNQKEI